MRESDKNLTPSGGTALRRCSHQGDPLGATETAWLREAHDLEHLVAEVLLDYVENRADEETRGCVDRHVAACEDCMGRLLGLLELFHEEGTAGVDTDTWLGTASGDDTVVPDVVHPSAEGEAGRADDGPEEGTAFWSSFTRSDPVVRPKLGHPGRVVVITPGHLQGKTTLHDHLVKPRAAGLEKYPTLAVNSGTVIVDFGNTTTAVKVQLANPDSRESKARRPSPFAKLSLAMQGGVNVQANGVPLDERTPSGRSEPTTLANRPPAELVVIDTDRATARDWSSGLVSTKDSEPPSGQPPSEGTFANPREPILEWNEVAFQLTGGGVRFDPNSLWGIRNGWNGGVTHHVCGSDGTPGEGSMHERERRRPGTRADELDPPRDEEDVLLRRLLDAIPYTSQSLRLMGETGCGKTYYFAAELRKAILRGYFLMALDRMKRRREPIGDRTCPGKQARQGGYEATRPPREPSSSTTEDALRTSAERAPRHPHFHCLPVLGYRDGKGFVALLYAELLDPGLGECYADPQRMKHTTMTADFVQAAAIAWHVAKVAAGPAAHRNVAVRWWLTEPDGSVPKRLEGSSLSAALALLWTQLLCGILTRLRSAVSATLLPDGRLAPVGHVGEKVTAAFTAPCSPEQQVERVIVHPGNAAEALTAATVTPRDPEASIRTAATFEDLQRLTLSIPGPAGALGVMG